MSNSRLRIRALQLLHARPSTLCATCQTRVLAQSRCSSSASDTPILSRLRPDLKAAMQSKDTPRLNVLRAVLALITNASKTAKPVHNDVVLLGVLRKQLNTMEASKAEFEAAGRQDLVEKEDAQIRVLKDYVGMVDVMGAEEIKAVVREAIDSVRSAGGKLDIGTVMRTVKEKLGTKPVDMADVSKAVKEAMA